MNRLFNKLTLSAKLAVVGLIPLLCLLYVSFYFNREKTERIVIVQNFGKRVEETAAITRLVDMLQTERRYSHACSLNGMARNEMVQARSESDKAFQELESMSSERLGDLRSYTMINLLPPLRSQLDQQQASPGQVMDVYTKMILRLNVLSVMSTQNIPYLERLNADLRGQRILSQMITYLGIIRSGVYEILFLKDKDPESSMLLQNNYQYYHALENEFLLKASGSSRSGYLALKNSAEVKAMFEILNSLEHENTLIGKISPAQWWDLSVVAVDQIKQLQRNILSQVQKKTAEVLREEERARSRNVFFIFLNVILVVLVVMLVLTNISRLLSNLKNSAELIALGQRGTPLRITTNDAIGKLAESIHFIDVNNVQLAQTATEIGRGNFDVTVKPRSEEDVLGNAIVSMKNDLQTFRKENEKKIWIQNGISLINDSVRGEKNMSDLTETSLSSIADYLKAQTALYYVAENNVLYYSAGYAVSNQEAISRSYKLGESLVGQAARDGQIKVLTDVPDSYIKISSAAGNSVPRQITIIPLFHNEMLEGVIELATIKPLGQTSMDLITAVAPLLAISLQVARNRAKLKELLEETQAQSEELQTQHSELESLNSELEMQSQKLQASEEELRVQQEELQQTNEELEERSSLLEEKNVEIRRKAEELELTTKYKSEFLANVSHELRTPLNSILLLSRLLNENHDKNLNDEQIEYARVIQSSGSGLLALIDEILDLSKIEAGKMQLEYLQVGVKEIVSDMESLFRVMAREKGLELEMQLEKDVPATIITDKTRLEQIIKNLLSNALKFTANGSVKLRVSKHPKNPSMVSFSVTDTGIGIAKEKQPLVFEAFQQADGSTKRKFGGTGLGLSISRELARLLGGDIILQSAPGQGSTFTLHIPVSGDTNIKEQQQPAESAIPAAKPEDPEARFRSMIIPENIPDDRGNIKEGDRVILIIEDDTNFAKSLLDYTRQKGYRGLVAVRGDEGIELARLYRPVGILLDIQLPVKSGWEVIDDLKSNAVTRHIPVHMMSSIHMKKESMSKGAINFIDKPMAFEQMHEIFKKLEYVLERKTKKVLIIEDNSKHAKALAYFLETFNINSDLKGNVKDGIRSLTSKEVDCVILDMGIPDERAYEMLEEAKQNKGLEDLPIIIFTGKSLSKSEEARIKKYADSIIVKTAHSYQRMLDEISLFLHIMEEDKSNGTRSNGSKKLGALSDVLRDKTVLIADDDVRNIYSLTKALEVHNMNVITAVDGAEALQKLQEHSEIDLVLLDMMMPNMDGYETARKIRENFQWRDLPVIAVTAKAMSGDREKCIRAGASDYITKPVDIDQLVSLLRVWLYD